MLQSRKLGQGAFGCELSDIKDISEDISLASNEGSKNSVEHLVSAALRAIEDSKNPNDYAVNVVMVSIHKR